MMTVKSTLLLTIHVQQVLESVGMISLPEIPQNTNIILSISIYSSTSETDTQFGCVFLIFDLICIDIMFKHDDRLTRTDLAGNLLIQRYFVVSSDPSHIQSIKLIFIQKVFYLH